MKKVFLVTALLVSLIAFSNSESLSDNINPEIEVQTSFCEGWDEGYCEGWKDVKGQYSVCPVTPVCPVPPIGKNNYKGGYNEGFKAGMKKARKS